MGPDVPGLQAHQGQAKTRPYIGDETSTILWRSIMEIIGYTLIYIISDIYIYIFIYIYISYIIWPITEISGYTWYMPVLPITTYQWYDPHSMSPSFLVQIPTCVDDSSCLVIQMRPTRCRRLGRWTAPICRPALRRCGGNGTTVESWIWMGYCKQNHNQLVSIVNYIGVYNYQLVSSIVGYWYLDTCMHAYIPTYIPTYLTNLHN